MERDTIMAYISGYFGTATLLHLSIISFSLKPSLGFVLNSGVLSMEFRRHGAELSTKMPNREVEQRITQDKDFTYMQ